MRKATGGFVIGALLFLSAPAFAAPAKPVEISAVIRSPQPLGAGTMRWLLMPIYDASLWTDAARWSMNTPFALTLTYHMSASADDIVQHSLEEMSHVDPALSPGTLAVYRAAMTKLFSDVKSGDEVTGLYTPDGTVKIFRDGLLTGQVHDPAFAQRFFGIWFSPATSEPDLRAKLLNQT
jgi:hypothetical protein